MNFSASSKTDLSKVSPDQVLKSDEVETKVCNGSLEVKVENKELISEQQPVNEKGESNVSNDIKQCEDVSIGSDQTEFTENQVVKCDTNDEVLIKNFEDSNKPLLRIDDSVILEQTSKKDIRKKVWEFMEENSLVVFPKPCFNRIPNFKGCNTASQLLEKLEEFRKAKTVQVTPDKAQETARFITLSVSTKILCSLNYLI